MTITNSKYEYGVSGLHRLTPPVIPNNGFEYGISAVQPVMNIFPKKATPILPLNGTRTDTMPTFVFKIERDYNHDNLHLELTLSEKPNLENGTIFFSSSNQKGWEYLDKNNNEWVAMTYIGVPDSALVSGNTEVRFTPQAKLEQSRLFYWGVRVYDTKDFSFVSDILTLKSSNVLSLELSKPIETSIHAEKIIATAYSEIPTDGVNKAEFKVYVTNNGFDENPTWEDASYDVLRKQSHSFTNRTKTSDKWGVNVRYEIHAHDSLNPISFSALGISFN